jgi:Flp pilus assembly protein TadD
LAPPSDEYTDVQRLIRAKRYGDALARAEQHLQQKPRDAQMRFLLSVIQADTGERANAIATLESLTNDFPELAEPYNNLAVLQAAAGDMDAARASLEAAVRADPAYAVAHENLGDILVALAARAYARAAQLAPLPSTEARLKMSREWLAALQTAPTNPPDPEPAPRLKVLPSSMYNNNPVFINVPLRR